MRRLFALLSSLAIAASVFASPVAAGGPPSLAFYVDGVRYRTVGTPTDFSNTGAPDSTYDKIYALGNGLVNVAEAAPGDSGFNGGRWAVYPVTWNTTPTQLTSDEEVLAWADAGAITIASSPVRLFFCSVNKVPGSAANH
jgi:hypothetical protein